jgi:hypothetical protein
MGLYPINKPEVQRDSAAGCLAGCLPGILAAIVLAIGEAVLASQHGRSGNYGFVPDVVLLACVVSWLRHQFRPLGARPSSGCAWFVMILTAAFVLLGSFVEQRPPSTFFGR